METSIDKDLEFLSGCRNEELKKLCDILTFNKMGLYRISEHLTDTDEYIRHYPHEMDQMAGAIANELLCDGTNSIVMAWNSGQPDSYDDVLWRVCKCMKADVSREDSVVAKEHGLLLKLCSDAISQMSEEELREIADKAGISEKSLNKQMITAAIMFAIRKNPRIFAKVVIFIARRILLFIAGRGAAKAGVGVVERVLGVVTGPVGWVALTAWTMWDLATPAMRVCIPAVVQVAIMRMESTPRLSARRAA